jgi:hypothetical protein
MRELGGRLLEAGVQCRFKVRDSTQRQPYAPLRAMCAVSSASTSDPLNTDCNSGRASGLHHWQLKNMKNRQVPLGLALA